jgi:uncharacterized protein
MYFKKIILLSFVFFCNLSYSQVQDQIGFKFPNQIGYVNDFEHVFSLQQVKELNDILVKHEKTTSNEIAVVTILTYKPYTTLFDYSLTLANKWGVGKKDKNNGVVLVFGKKIREIRIQVSDGLVKKLTDDEAKKIVNETIIPNFKKGDFFNATKLGLIQIMEQIK